MGVDVLSTSKNRPSASAWSRRSLNFLIRFLIQSDLRHPPINLWRRCKTKMVSNGGVLGVVLRLGRGDPNTTTKIQFKNHILTYLHLFVSLQNSQEACVWLLKGVVMIIFYFILIEIEIRQSEGSILTVLMGVLRKNRIVFQKLHHFTVKTLANQQSTYWLYVYQVW